MIMLTRPSKIMLLICTCLAGLWGCEKRSVSKDGRNFARVGNKYLTLQEAKRAIAPAIYEEDSTYALQQYRQQWIQEQLILQQANKFELRQKKEVRRKIEHAQHEVLREALRTRIISTQVDSVISDQEVKRYFEANKEHFVLDQPFVRFRHLKSKDVKAARAARIALQNEKTWEVIAAKYGMNANRSIREARQYHALSMALDQIDIMNRYLQNMEDNQISPIKRVNGVYHFVQLLDRRSKGDYPDMKWIKSELKNRILMDKRQRKFNSYLKNLYLKAQSDNEIDTFNVLTTKSNSKNTSADTLESNSTHE